MPRDQDAVARDNEVGFDEVRALVDRERAGGVRVFWPFAAGAAVGNDDWRLAVAREVGPVPVN